VPSVRQPLACVELMSCKSSVDSPLGTGIMRGSNMALQAGTRLGPYEVVSVTGAGGMGEVWKARDTRLDRTVAVKVLASDLTSDPAARQRFEREARAVAALSHPHICPLFDIGHQDGSDYLVMEFLDGETLTHRLSRGKLPLDQSLKYGIQIAEGLAAAHEAGIVHRDLKPGNIMLTKNGAKLLDFGLAKPVLTAPDSETPTILSMSGPLTVVGTLAYMSPEQASGKDVDQRSDVFSFGVILHEMVTGHHPFAHPTPTATLSAILHSEVKFSKRSASAAGRALDEIIARCLVKGRDKRYQTIELVRQDLERTQRLLTPASGRMKSGRLLATVVVVLAVVAGWRWNASRQVPEPLLVPVPVTTYEGDEIQPSLSPEGDRVAFSWNGEKQDNFDIYAKLLESGSALRLTTDAANDSSPAWSPDGRSIAFLRGRAGQPGTVFIIPAMGGDERKVTTVRLLPAFYPGRALAWSPDSKWLACSCGEGVTLLLISAETGATRPLTHENEFAGTRGDIGPAFSPDGAQLAFARFLGGPGELFVLPLNADYTRGGTARQLTFDKGLSFAPAWLSDGDLLFVSGRSIAEQRLWRMKTAPNQRATSLGSLGDNLSGPTTARPRSGEGVRVVYERRSSDTNIWRLDLAAGSSGSLTRVASSSADDNDPSLSPLGNEIAFSSNRSGTYQLWLSDTDGSHARQLLKAGEGGARWSPDGQQLVYETPESGRHLAIANRDGTGRQELKTVRDGVVPSFSRDGQWIYFSSRHNEGPYRVWKVGHPHRRPSEEPLQVTQHAGTYSEESVDGAYIYFATSFSTGPIWRVPSHGGQEEVVIDEPVHWSNFIVVSDGIYYMGVPRPGAAPTSSQFFGVPGNALRFFRFSDRTTQTIHKLTRPVYMGLSVSRDRSHAFLTQVDHQGSDLLVVNGIR
jgi:eukaryotic-like serine/threonine-protein kinase